MNKSLIISLIAALLLVIFAIQNAGETEITLWFWSFKGTLALVILISVIFGVLMSYVFTFPSIHKKNKTISAREDEIKKLKEQVISLQKLNPANQSNEAKP